MIPRRQSQRTTTLSKIHTATHRGKAPVIEIIVEPVGHHDRFAARLDGRVLVASSRQPFLDAARVLLREGHDPRSVLVMRHRGSSTESLHACLGVAAGLTVEERDARPPRFARWKALHLTDGSSRTAEDDAPGTHLPAEAAE